MGQRVDDRVVDGRGLGEEDRQLGGVGREVIAATDQRHQSDQGVGEPGEEVEAEDGDGDLGGLYVGLLVAGLDGGLELLGHRHHLELVLPDGLHDLVVAEDDDADGQREAEDVHAAVEDEVALVLGQVVEGAGGLEAFRHVAAVAEEGRNRPEEAPDPGEGAHAEGPCVGQRAQLLKGLYDDEESVQRDQGHRGDRYEPEEAADEAVYLAGDGSPGPARVEGGDGEQREAVDRREGEVGDGQADDEGVGRCTDVLGAGEDVDHQQVANDAPDANDRDVGADEVVVDLGYRREGLPMRMDQLLEGGIPMPWDRLVARLDGGCVGDRCGNHVVLLLSLLSLFACYC